jgi:hypothetical protein
MSFYTMYMSIFLLTCDLAVGALSLSSRVGRSAEMAGTPVSFAQGFADSSYRLFELEEPVLQEVLKNDGQ